VNRTAFFTALLCIALLTAGSKAVAYESAYEKAALEEVEVRLLPAGRWLVTATDGRYFDRSGTLFNRLFNYIKQNDVSMTVPVEGRLERAEMRFFAEPGAAASLESSDAVEVVEVPERRVARIGGRGSYSEGNIDEARAALLRWLGGQGEWRAAGDAYAVFWNGPFTPWFLKRFEVHVPVERAGGG